MRGFVRAGTASDGAVRQRAGLPHRADERAVEPRPQPGAAGRRRRTARRRCSTPRRCGSPSKAAGTVDARAATRPPRPGSTVTARLRPHDGGRRVADQRAARGLRPVDRQHRCLPARAALRRALRLDQPACPGAPTPGGSRSTSSPPGWPAPRSNRCPHTSRARRSRPCRPAPACSGMPCRSSPVSRPSTSSPASWRRGRPPGRTCGPSSSAPSPRTVPSAGSSSRSAGCPSTCRPGRLGGNARRGRLQHPGRPHPRAAGRAPR